jgi:hypothetical protein
MKKTFATVGLVFSYAAFIALTSCEQKTETMTPTASPPESKAENNTTIVNPSTQMASEHAPDVGGTPSDDRGTPPPQ